MSLGMFEALHAIPRLDGALCVGHHLLFDPDEPPAKSSVELALETCEACPALAACREWYTSLPRKERPFGVTAGIYRKPGKLRKERAA